MPTEEHPKVDLNLEDLPFDPPEALLDAARRVLPDAAPDDLALLDRAVNYHFLRLLRPATPRAERETFLKILDQLTDLPEIRKDRVPPGRTLLAANWDQRREVLATVMEDVPLVESAREFLNTRQYGWELLEHVKQAKRQGERLTSGELAERLNRSHSAVSQVLAKLEAVGVVERRRSGGNTLVWPGPLADQVELPQRAMKPGVSYRNTDGPLVGRWAMSA